TRATQRAPRAAESRRRRRPSCAVRRRGRVGGFGAGAPAPRSVCPVRPVTDRTGPAGCGCGKKVSTLEAFHTGGAGGRVATRRAAMRAAAAQRSAVRPGRTSMIERKVPATAVTDPREWKQLMLDAASRGPTAVDEATGTIYVLRYRDIERL